VAREEAKGIKSVFVLVLQYWKPASVVEIQELWFILKIYFTTSEIPLLKI
jgi:hypothetical protein